MIFRRNKPASGPAGEERTMRGRESEPDKRGANALARRFLVEDEPATIDLTAPGRFPVSPGEAEPETRPAGEAPADSPQASREALISRDPDTGKFYVHPGMPHETVLLGGEPVTSSTELRRGDCIRIGTAEFEFKGPADTA